MNEREAAAVWVPVTALKPWTENPRKNDAAVDRVAESIRRFGFGAPLLARLADGELIAGHTRLKAAIKLGIDRVPVRYLPLDPVDAHLLALADNKIGEIAEWDDDALGKLLAEMRANDVDLTSGLGFSDEEIARLIEDGSSTAGADGDGRDADSPTPDATEALRAKWGVEPGQLWVIEGRRGTTHWLLCGDCRRGGDVERLLHRGKVALAFTSPPYASQRTYDETSEFRPIPPDAYVDWFEPVQANVRAHLAHDGSFFVNIKEHAEDGERHLYVNDLVAAHRRRWDWKWIDSLCWVRGGVPGAWPNRFKNGFELVHQFAMQTQIKFRPDAVSCPTEHAFDYSPTNGKSVSGSGLLGKEHGATFHEGLARPSNVIEIGTGGNKVSGSHPAEFPVALPRWFLLAYSDAGDLVYDPFSGAGSTILAAEDLGRHGFGIEISPRYIAVALERFAAAGLNPRRA